MSRRSSWIDHLVWVKNHQDERINAYDEELIQEDPYLLQLEQRAHVNKPQEHSYEYDLFI